MGRNSYLGGNTILDPKDDAYRLDNTAPKFVGNDPDRPTIYIEQPSENSIHVDLIGMDFDFISEFFIAVQHDYIHGDWTVLRHLAEIYDRHGLGNYVLLLANKFWLGRKFNRKSGKILMEKNRKIKQTWNENCLVDLYHVLLEAHDPSFDELPKISTKIMDLVNANK